MKYRWYGKVPVVNGGLREYPAEELEFNWCESGFGQDGGNSWIRFREACAKD